MKRLLVLALSVSAPARADTLGDELGKLERWVTAQGGKLGASVVELGSGRVLASAGAELPLNPASVAKIATAATALSKLGPDHRWTTAVYGRIDGGAARELVLRGEGDPTLRTEHLAALANDLAARGLVHVDRILVDQSRFDDRFVPPAFDQQPNEWAAFRAPVSAIAVERNTITVHVLPTRAGDPAKVWVEPAGFAMLDARVETAAPGKGQRLAVTISPKGDRVAAVVRGHVAEGISRVRLRRRVDDPSTFAGYVLAEQLRKAGVDVGGVAAGASTEKRALATHVSEPLASVLHAVGKHSDNFVAEMLLKSIGGGSSAKGAAAAEAWLGAAGAAAGHVKIINGSGLFDANRLSASALVSALRFAHADPRVGPELVSQLAIGGVDGTLRSRFRTHRDARIVRAKTGTLARSVALAGYLLAERPLAFAIVVSGVAGKHPEIRQRIDRVVDASITVSAAASASARADRSCPGIPCGPSATARGTGSRTAPSSRTPAR